MTFKKNNYNEVSTLCDIMFLSNFKKFNMPLNTFYSLNDLQHYFSSTKPDGLLGRIFEHNNDDDVKKPLLLVIDDSVHMLDPSKHEIKEADPYMKERYHPNTGVARLRTSFGQSWEPDMEHSNVRFFCVRNKDELSDQALTAFTHYYVQDASKWYYCESKGALLTEVNLSHDQKKYIDDHLRLLPNQSRYPLLGKTIQHFLRATNSYEFLHMQWEESTLCLRDLQEQFTHFFVECGFVLNKEIRIVFTRNHPPIILDFSNNQLQKESLRAQSHELITRAFYIGLHGLSFSSDLLMSRINEKRNEFTNCTYIGQTLDKKRLSAPSAPNNVLHIEPSEIADVLSPLKSWLLAQKQTENKALSHQNPAQATRHVDPLLNSDEKYVPPSYRQERSTKAKANHESAQKSQVGWEQRLFGGSHSEAKKAKLVHTHADPMSPKPQRMQ